MLDKILSTFITRIATTLLTFAVVIINSNTFGAEGTGTIALFILGLTLLQVLSNFIGGSTLVYLTPRKKTFQLLFLSYIWAFFSNIVGLGALYLLKLIPKEYILHLLILTFIYSTYFIHVSVMQGKEEIRTYNIYQLSQALILIITLSASIVFCKTHAIVPTVKIYIYAYTLSYLLPMAATFFYIWKRVEKTTLNGMGALFCEMFKLGIWTQLANLAQLLTYRLNYYWVKGFIGCKPLGIYDLGTKISEAVWIFPKSICLVQYAHISNNHEKEYAKKLTLSLLKAVLLFSILAILILLALPASFIAWVFGPEFVNAKPVICSLLPGIVFLSCTSILSHHFAGYGKYWINATGSFIGLAVTAVLGYIFIPIAAGNSLMLGLKTAGRVTSIAYFATLLFTMICFFKFTKVHWREFLITTDDWRLLKEILHEKYIAFKKRKK